MTGRDLAEKILATVDDPDIDDYAAIAMINEGFLDMAETVRLPWLEQTAEVDTTLLDNYSDLPADYHRGLYQCLSAMGRKIEVIDSRARLLAKVTDPDAPGRVVMCCEVDNQLMYWPVPVEVETLRIFYYRKPTTVGFKTAIGATGAVQLRVENALFHYSVGKFFEAIEDGVEGQKVNTNYHLGMYQAIVKELKTTVETSVSMPAPPTVRGCYL